VLAEGQVLYTRYCAHCHGADGGGQGPVAQQYPGVANLKGVAYQTLAPGHIYWVITHGKGRMWPHGFLVDSPDRWKIVNYVLQLQGRVGNQPAPAEGDTAVSGDSLSISPEVPKKKTKR
ncbi:MAG: cytochrome c, partial [Saprospiraceae bacterium]|nr:cytochrome c [Saprospiraceae bacterium]